MRKITQCAHSGGDMKNTWHNPRLFTYTHTNRHFQMQHTRHSLLSNIEHKVSSCFKKRNTKWLVNATSKCMQIHRLVPGNQCQREWRPGSTTPPDRRKTKVSRWQSPSELGRTCPHQIHPEWCCSFKSKMMIRTRDLVHSGTSQNGPSEIEKQTTSEKWTSTKEWTEN